MSLSISMKVKTALVGAAVIAGVGLTGPAFAQVINDGSGGADGDLFLMIYDTVAKVSYVEDLGVTTAAVATDSQVATVIAGATGGQLSTALSYSASYSADTTLSSFLSAHSGDTFQWEVLANTSPTSVNSQTVLLSTSASPVAKTFTGSAGNGMSNSNALSNAVNLQGAIDGMAGDGIFALNGGIGGPNANSSATNPLTTDANAIGQASGQGLLTWYNTGNMTPAISWKPSSGSSVSNFYLIGANSNNSVADIVDLGTVTLAANGLLTFAAPAPSVPLPAALWLFGSGLLGLAGVARRRTA